MQLLTRSGHSTADITGKSGKDKFKQHDKDTFHGPYSHLPNRMRCTSESFRKEVLATKHDRALLCTLDKCRFCDYVYQFLTLQKQENTKQKNGDRECSLYTRECHDWSSLTTDKMKGSSQLLRHTREATNAEQMS